MTIHLWHTKKLSRDLACGNVSEADGMKYMLAASLLYVYTAYWNLWFGSYRDGLFFVELVLVILIGLIGVYECYKANGLENGRDFVLRYCALAVPVGVKVSVLGLVAGQLLYFGSDAVLASGAFRDPGLVYRVIFFMLSVSMAFIYYWRIAHHMAAIAEMQDRESTRARSLVHQNLPVESPTREDAA